MTCAHDRRRLLSAAAVAAPLAAVVLAAPAAAAATLPAAFEPVPGGYATRADGFAVAVRAGGLDLLLPSERPADRWFPTVARLAVVGGRAVRPRPLGAHRATIVSYRGGGRVRRQAAAAVRLSGVRRGVDLDVHSRRGPLEFDLRLAPAVDPQGIELQAHGADHVQLNQDGRIVLRIGSRQLLLDPPVAYQSRNGRRVAVRASFRTDGSRIGFRVGDYDRSRPLVIDPTLHYGSFFGGSGEDAASDIDLAPDGGPVIAGRTTSPDLPTVAAPFGAWHDPGPDGCDGRDLCHDAFVARLSPDGSRLVFATYLGGTSNDVARAVEVDAAGDVYVGGFTASPGFPTKDPYQAEWRCGGSTGDGFVTKLRADGTALVWSTFFGGCDDDRVEDLQIDGTGRVWLTGATSAYNFPTTPGAYLAQCTMWSNAQDCRMSHAFAARLSANGQRLEMSTLLGGSYTDVVGNALALDGAGRPVLAGTAYRASDFPTTAGAYDPTPDAYFSEAFLARFSADGSQLEYSTALGGRDWDGATDVALDTSGGAVVVGTTESRDFPTTEGALDRACGEGVDEFECTNRRDGFVARLADDGTRLDYSTFVGGVGHDTPGEVAILSDGALLVAGGGSRGFPVRDGFPSNETPGSCDSTSDCEDAFVLTLEPGGGAVRSGTLYGSGGHERAEGLATLPAGGAWIAGTTQSPGLPTTAAAIQSAFHAFDCPDFRACADGFVAKIGPEPAPASSDGTGPGNTGATTGAQPAAGETPATGQEQLAVAVPQPQVLAPPASTPARRLTVRARRTRAGRWALRGRVTVASGVRRCASRVPLRLQRRVGSRWRTVARTRTTATGGFAFRRVRPARLRVLAPAMERRAAGIIYRCGRASRGVTRPR